MIVTHGQADTFRAGVVADLDAIRQAHLDGRPESTHWDDCHLAHPHCAIAALLTEVQRLHDQEGQT